MKLFKGTKEAIKFYRMSCRSWYLSQKTQRLHLKALLLLGFGLSLFGCKAQEIELRLSANQISKAIEGNPQEVRFQAEFVLISKYDDETKRTIKKVKEISEKYFEILKALS